MALCPLENGKLNICRKRLLRDTRQETETDVSTKNASQLPREPYIIFRQRIEHAPNGVNYPRTAVMLLPAITVC